MIMVSLGTGQADLKKLFVILLAISPFLNFEHEPYQLYTNLLAFHFEIKFFPQKEKILSCLPIKNKDSITKFTRKVKNCSFWNNLCQIRVYRSAICIHET